MAQKDKPKAGTDDMERGNVGTGDQGPGDVSPHGKVDGSTGEMAPAKEESGSSKKES